MNVRPLTMEGIRRTRHALPAGIIADLTGAVIAVIICRAVFG